MNKSKKAVLGIHWLFLIIAFIAGVIILFIGLNKFQITGYVGETTHYLKEALGEANDILYYLHLSSSIATKQTLFDLGLQGGSSSCGVYLGYALWTSQETPTKDCRPSSSKVQQSFSAILSDHIASFLDTYPSDFDLVIPSSNYDISISDTIAITGKAKQPISISLATKEQILQSFEQEKQLAILEEQTTQIPKDNALSQQGTIKITQVPCAGACILNKEAYEKLLQAYSLASQKGLKIYVTSTSRTIQQQKDLWDLKTAPKSLYEIAARNGQDLKNPSQRRNYICNPYNGASPESACPHTTGKAVDVVIEGKGIAYISDYEWKQIESVMTQTGWVRYQKESWHFECCNTERHARAQQKGATVIT